MKRRALFVSVLLCLAACQGGSQEQSAADTAEQSAVVEEQSATPDSSAPERLVVYYFHTNYRCPTCNMFERVTREIAAKDFAEETKAGRIELRVVNVEEPPNKHFIEDYRLNTKSVVLSKVSGEKQTGWTNLDRIWQLARNEDKLRAYIREGIAKELRVPDEG